MKYSIHGQTGARVSQIALGTATFGVAPRAEDAEGVRDFLHGVFLRVVYVLALALAFG